MYARREAGRDTSSLVRFLSIPQSRQAASTESPGIDNCTSLLPVKTTRIEATMMNNFPIQTLYPMCSLKIIQASRVVATVSKLRSSDTSDAVPKRIPYARKRGAATPPDTIAPERLVQCRKDRELRMSKTGVV